MPLGMTQKHALVVRVTCVRLVDRIGRMEEDVSLYCTEYEKTYIKTPMIITVWD